MNFMGSVLLVAGSAAAVSFAIFAGYALSVHHSEPILIGGAALAVGIVLLAIYARIGGPTADMRDH